MRRLVTQMEKLTMAHFYPRQNRMTTKQFHKTTCMYNIMSLTDMVLLAPLAYTFVAVQVYVICMCTDLTFSLSPYRPPCPQDSIADLIHTGQCYDIRISPPLCYDIRIVCPPPHYSVMIFLLCVSPSSFPGDYHNYISCLNLIKCTFSFESRHIIFIFAIMARISSSDFLQTETLYYLFDTVQSLLTVMTHFGIISLLSALRVLRSFLRRYSSSWKTPRVLSNFQNALYNLYRFSSFAGWGPQAPRRKSGGNAMTQGEHKQLGQLFLPRRIGQLLDCRQPSG